MLLIGSIIRVARVCLDIAITLAGTETVITGAGAI
mgnify:CR=1 FL=1